MVEKIVGIPVPVGTYLLTEEHRLLWVAGGDHLAVLVEDVLTGGLSEIPTPEVVQGLSRPVDEEPWRVVIPERERDVSAAHA
jgi:hypothetical protein